MGLLGKVWMLSGTSGTISVYLAAQGRRFVTMRGGQAQTACPAEAMYDQRGARPDGCLPSAWMD